MPCRPWYTPASCLPPLNEERARFPPLYSDFNAEEIVVPRCMPSPPGPRGVDWSSLRPPRCSNNSPTPQTRPREGGAARAVCVGQIKPSLPTFSNRRFHAKGVMIPYAYAKAEDLFRLSSPPPVLFSVECWRWRWPVGPPRHERLVLRSSSLVGRPPARSRPRASLPSNRSTSTHARRSQQGGATAREPHQLLS